MDTTKLSEPPAPPAELAAPAVADAPPQGEAPALSDEAKIQLAADTYTNHGGFVVDMLLERRGWTPMTPAERAKWREAWVAECRARPFLVSASGVVPPELTLLLFVVGVIGARRDAERKELEKNGGADGEGAGT